jgi:hypothetical protein
MSSHRSTSWELRRWTRAVVEGEAAGGGNIDRRGGAAPARGLPGGGRKGGAVSACSVPNEGRK